MNSDGQSRKPESSECYSGMTYFVLLRVTECLGSILPSFKPFQMGVLTESFVVEPTAAHLDERTEFFPVFQDIICSQLLNIQVLNDSVCGFGSICFSLWDAHFFMDLVSPEDNQGQKEVTEITFLLASSSPNQFKWSKLHGISQQMIESWLYIIFGSLYDINNNKNSPYCASDLLADNIKAQRNSEIIWSKKLSFYRWGSLSRGSIPTCINKKNGKNNFFEVLQQKTS